MLSLTLAIFLAQPGINLSEAKPDFWVSNCHKWLYCKRGCAVLYVPKRSVSVLSI